MSCDIFAAIQDSDDYFPLAKGLLDVGMNPNWHTPNWSCLPLLTDAVEDGRVDLVKLLLEAGTNVEKIEEQRERPDLMQVNVGEKEAG